MIRKMMNSRKYEEVAEEEENNHAICHVFFFLRMSLRSRDQ